MGGVVRVNGVDARGVQDTGRLTAGTGAGEDGGVEGCGVGLDHVFHDEAVDVLGALVQEVVGDALENLEALRGQDLLGVRGLRLGGGTLFSDPGGVGTTGDDGDVATEAVDVADAELLAQHHAAELAVIGEGDLLLEGIAVAVFGGVGVVVVAEHGGREEEAVGARLDFLELTLTFLGHLGLDSVEVAVGGLTEELGDGEALHFGLLLRGEGALVGEGLAGGLVDLRLLKVTGETVDLFRQGGTLRDFLAGFELTQLGVELKGNLIGVSHDVKRFLPKGREPWRLWMYSQSPGRSR